MNAKERRDEFLAKAKEARDQAAHTKDRYEQESWLRIAESYFELARLQSVPEN